MRPNSPRSPMLISHLRAAVATVSPTLLDILVSDSHRHERAVAARSTVWQTGHDLGGKRAMVVQAYILIQTEVGKAASVAREISGMKGVTLAEDVTGPYDVIVRAEARNIDEMGRMVVAQVQSVDGITRTLTCPVVHL
jgi:DNA-binding Lrp family transcriptional regulator